MLKMAVLLSGSGRTLDNFHERIQKGTLNAEIQVVLSNVADALGLEKARRYGYPTFHAEGNKAINEILANYEIELIALAGYLKLYEPPDQLKQRVLNIHPALIPSFCGEGFYGHHVHKSVLESNEEESGITIHLVNEKYDEGKILFQKSTPIFDNDDVASLSSRIHNLEYKYFPKIIENVILKKH